MILNITLDIGRRYCFLQALQSQFCFKKQACLTLDSHSNPTDRNLASTLSPLRASHQCIEWSLHNNQIVQCNQSPEDIEIICQDQRLVAEKLMSISHPDFDPNTDYYDAYQEWQTKTSLKNPEQTVSFNRYRALIKIKGFD